MRQSAREQARRHRRIPSAGRHALPAASPQVPRCRADALSRRPCRTRQPPDVLQSDWECASQLHRTRAPSDARCVCSSPLGRPRRFECGPSRADRRSGHCARSRRSLRPHFSIVRRFIALSLGISSHTEDHRTHFTQSGKQSEIGRSLHLKAFAR